MVKQLEFKANLKHAMYRFANTVYGSEDALCESYEPVPSADFFSDDDWVGSCNSPAASSDFFSPLGKRHEQCFTKHVEASASTFIEYTAASITIRTPV